MSGPFSLIGSVSVAPESSAELASLIQALEPSGEEFVQIVDGKLYVFIDSEEVPYCYPEPARQALFGFCAKYATEAAMFVSDDAALLVGPDTNARQAKLDSFVLHQASGGQQAMPEVFTPEGTNTYLLAYDNPTIH